MQLQLELFFTIKQRQLSNFTRMENSPKLELRMKSSLVEVLMKIIHSPNYSFNSIPFFYIGIVNSPQLLLNSGIGPREELESIGIPVIHHLPGVGKNLHDQVLYPLAFSTNETVINDLNWASAMEYFLYRKGPLSGLGNF